MKNKLYVKVLGEELIIKKEVVQMIYSMDGINVIALKNPDTRELSILVFSMKKNGIVFFDHFENKIPDKVIQSALRSIKNNTKELDTESKMDLFSSLYNLSRGQKITNRDEVVLGHKLLKNVVIEMKNGDLYFRSKELGTEIEIGIANIETSGYKYKKVTTPNPNKITLELKKYAVPMLFQSETTCVYGETYIVEAPTPETAMLMVLNQKKEQKKEEDQKDERKELHMKSIHFGMPLIMQAFLFEEMKDVLKGDEMIFQYTIPNNSLRIGCNWPGQELIAGKMYNMYQNYVDSIRRVIGSEIPKEMMESILKEVTNHVQRYAKEGKIAVMGLAESYGEEVKLIKSKLKGV